MLVSLVIARVIAESGAPMPALDDDFVLMIKRTNVVVGDGCNEGRRGSISLFATIPGRYQWDWYDGDPRDYVTDDAQPRPRR